MQDVSPHCWMISTPLPDDDRKLRADPGLVETWAHGWALTREVGPPVRDSGALRIDVGWPEQKARYVFWRCSDDVRRLAERIHEPWMLIKVCAPAERVQPLLPPGWVIQNPGFMMTHVISTADPAPQLPNGYGVELTSGPPVWIVHIKGADGEVAASGRLALVDGLAVFDRIRTHENHRRQGLGRAVMRRLGNVAVSRDTTKAALVATAEGRMLYRTLGWQLHSLYTTALIPGQAS